MKDGWHTIAGFRIYIEDGKVMRGVKNQGTLKESTSYPYKTKKKP